MKKIYLIALFVLCVHNWAYSQTEVDKTQNESWELIQEKDGVKLFGNNSHCGGLNVVFLKIENANDKSVTIDIEKNNNNGITETPAEPQSLILDSKSTLLGGCGSMYPPQLTIVINGESRPEISMRVTLKP